MSYIPTNRFEGLLLYSYRLIKKHRNTPAWNRLAAAAQANELEIMFFPTIAWPGGVAIYTALVYPIKSSPGWGVIDTADMQAKYPDTKEKHRIPYLKLTRSVDQRVTEFEIKRWIRKWR